MEQMEDISEDLGTEISLFFFLGGLLFFCFFGEVMAVKGLKMCVHDQGGSRCRLEFASLHSLKMLPQECCSISAALVEVSQTVYD